MIFWNRIAIASNIHSDFDFFQRRSCRLPTYRIGSNLFCLCRNQTTLRQPRNRDPRQKPSTQSRHPTTRPTLNRRFSQDHHVEIVASLANPRNHQAYYGILHLRAFRRVHAELHQTKIGWNMHLRRKKRWRYSSESFSRLIAPLVPCQDLFLNGLTDENQNTSSFLLKTTLNHAMTPHREENKKDQKVQ